MALTAKEADAQAAWATAGVTSYSVGTPALQWCCLMVGKAMWCGYLMQRRQPAEQEQGYSC
jgi:hypothetical protein